ncbi:T4SS efffector SepA family protein [Xanthobacter aminoxidans]|uniref:T4SS efffector SepA family protein n=1 Tax=Xanthobacter aminoxidans TaxID=186280 RepID=UPI00372D2DC6
MRELQRDGLQAMPVSISISDETYRRLQAVAEPFVDTTPETVIVKLLLAWERGGTGPSSVTHSNEAGASARRRFDPRNPPSLTHTKMTAASTHNLPIPNPTWNGLMEFVLRLALTRLGALSELRRIVNVNLIEGAKSDEGYRYVPGGNFSVQGQDANAAWRAIVQVADHLQIGVSVEFEWRAKPEAQYPGVEGQMILEF